VLNENNKYNALNENNKYNVLNEDKYKYNTLIEEESKYVLQKLKVPYYGKTYFFSASVLHLGICECLPTPKH